MKKKLFSEIPYIEEGNITLRALTQDDAEQLQEFMEQEKSFKYLPAFLFEMQYDDAKKVIDLLYTECIKESIILGVFVSGDFCGLAEYYGYKDEIHKVSVGYRSLEKYWGKDIATEALSLTVKYLFEETDIEIITTSVMIENARSHAVMKKNGFHLVEHAAEEDWGRGEPVLVDKYIRRKIDLTQYDYKKVKVTVPDDPDRFTDPVTKNDPDFSRYLPYIESLGDGNMTLTGIAEESPHEFGEAELGRDEESISVCGYQVFESDIVSIEIINTAIDDYIAAQDPEIRKTLDSVRAVISDTILDAEEKISYGMPTWRRKHNLIHFAAQKHHLGIYPGPEAISHFADILEHRGFRYSKGAIQFPYDKIELDLIEIIAEYCGKENT